MVAELMGEMNLVSIRNGAKVNHTRYVPKVKKDRIKLNFSTSASNQVWVSDVTYYILNEKTYYICAIIDLYSRKVIAYKISRACSTFSVKSKEL